MHVNLTSPLTYIRIQGEGGGRIEYIYRRRGEKSKEDENEVRNVESLTGCWFPVTTDTES